MKRQNATTQKTFANDIANEPRSTTNNEGKKTLLRPYLSAKMPRTIAPTAQPKNKMACASQAKKARLQTRSNWKTSTIIYLKAVDSMTWLLFCLIMLSKFRRVWSSYSFVLVRLNELNASWPNEPDCYRAENSAINPAKSNRRSWLAKMEFRWNYIKGWRLHFAPLIIAKVDCKVAPNPMYIIFLNVVKIWILFCLSKFDNK